MDEKRLSTFNQVKHTIVNELGLTKDSIRAMTETVIRSMIDEAAKKKIHEMLNENTLEKYVNNAFEQWLKRGRWSNEDARKLIADKAGEVFSSYVTKALKDGKFL